MPLITVVDSGGKVQLCTSCDADATRLDKASQVHMVLKG